MTTPLARRITPNVPAQTPKEPVGGEIRGGYVTKDSGARHEYPNGMRRDIQDDKARFDLVMPKGIPYKNQLLTRIAELMARGAKKYGERNWEKGFNEEALVHAEASAFRHFIQWMAGEDDEDHAAAVFFNIQQVEYLKEMRGRDAAD